MVINMIIPVAMWSHNVHTLYVVRLVNGSTEYEGRVEVHYNGEWGTVCDDGWDLNDAQVICRQLGLGSAIATSHNAFYGQGRGPIWFNSVNCSGTELNIKDCSHGGWEINNCSHGEDAGVKCAIPIGKHLQYVHSTSSHLVVIISFVVRLVNGPTKYEGRVELYYNGQWGTVCDDGWDLNDAQVVCRQLGFGPALTTKNMECSSKICLYNMNCTGSELTIEGCSHSGWRMQDSDNEECAGLVCAATNGNFVTVHVYVRVYVCTYNLTAFLYLLCNYVVRLINGSTEYEGRVEVYYNGEWGTVCDDGWDLNDAQVVCRQLGFGTTIATTDSTFFGKGSGQILLKNLSCLGTELSIEDCSHGGWGIEDCSHEEYAGVRCAVPHGNFL